MGARLVRRTGCLLATAMSQCVMAGTGFTVDSTADLPDANPGDGICSTVDHTCTLRAALMEANRASVIGQAIYLPAGTFQLTIPPTGANGDDSGDLNITSPGVNTIWGAGANMTIIDAGTVDRVFSVGPVGQVVLRDMTLVNGTASGDGGCIENQGYVSIRTVAVVNCNAQGKGGALHNANGGIALSSDSVFANGRSSSGGGAIDNEGDLKLDRSILEFNNAPVGGGLYAASGSTTVVSQSAIHSNRSYSQGGGIYGNAPLTIVNSTVAGNTASTDGGGIFFRVAANVHADLFNTTLVFNTSDGDGDGSGSGGGVAIGGTTNDALSAVNVYNSIVSGNYIGGQPIPDDCDGRLLSHGNNLIGVGPYCGPQGCLPNGAEACAVTRVTGQNVLLNSVSLLGGIDNNGGVTPTVALLAGNNAIDAGAANGCRDQNGPALTVDQRGFPRPVGTACDIGAYESGSSDPNDGIFANGFD